MGIDIYENIITTFTFDNTKIRKYIICGRKMVVKNYLSTNEQFY